LGLSSVGWILWNMALYGIYLTFRAISEPINRQGELYHHYLQSKEREGENGSNIPKSTCITTDGHESGSRQRKFNAEDVL